jgi:hypothetical protein
VPSASSGGALPVVVTLVGWLILAKGLLLLFLTPEAHPGAIGIYLTWAGSPRRRSGGSRFSD